MFFFFSFARRFELDWRRFVGQIGMKVTHGYNNTNKGKVTIDFNPLCISLRRWCGFRTYCVCCLESIDVSVCLSIYFDLFHVFCIFFFLCEMTIFFVGSYLIFVILGLSGVINFHHQQVQGCQQEMITWMQNFVVSFIRK